MKRVIFELLKPLLITLAIFAVAGSCSWLACGATMETCFASTRN